MVGSVIVKSNPSPRCGRYGEETQDIFTTPQPKSDPVTRGNRTKVYRLVGANLQRRRTHDPRKSIVSERQLPLRRVDRDDVTASVDLQSRAARHRHQQRRGNRDPLPTRRHDLR